MGNAVRVVVTGVISREGSAWLAHCPELEIDTFGDSLEDAKRNLAEAITAYVEAAEAAGRLDELRRVLDERSNLRSSCAKELRESQWLTLISHELIPA